MTTTWLNTNGDGFWSTAADWSNGLPDNTKIAVFDGGVGGSNASVAYDSSVLTANQVVAGLLFKNSYTGTLSMGAGFALTVAVNPMDTTTGFQMSTGNISQSTVNDILIITGGGSASNNKWSGGTINNSANQSNLYINGMSTLRITGSAANLGDNIIVGEDGSGDSTLEFLNQTTTLSVNNNAYLETAHNNNDLTPANQILFDTDVTQGGNVTKGLATTSVDSFIENFGQIIRSNPGIYQTDLPIRNNPITSAGDKGLLDIQSSTNPSTTATGLWISGSSLNKTASVSLDQEGGETELENGAIFKVNQEALIKAGLIVTQGSAQAVIQTVNVNNAALDFEGGTLLISQLNQPLYGSLEVSGDMIWHGGTFQCYINGGTAGQQTQLSVGGKLNLSTNAHLQINVNGNRTSGLTWTPVTAAGGITNTLTFDSGNLFTIAYNPAGNPTRIDVTSN